MKKRFIQLVIFVLMLSFIPFQANAKTVQLDLLVLGDSLAAGVTPNREVGRGYGDFLALMLDEYDLLGSFNKGFSEGGYKTTDVLKDLEDNVIKGTAGYDYYLTGERGELVSIKEAIAEAEVIVMSIGANDVLANVSRNDDGSLNFNALEVMGAIGKVAGNIKTIIEKIYEVNPETYIVFMGYYNPFPYNEKDSFMLNTMVDQFDSTIKSTVEQMGAVFVDVKAEIAKNYLTYLPNPKDIHLSEAGYKYVAEEMYDDLLLMHIFNPPTGVPADIIGHWSENFVMIGIESGLIKGYDDGTFRPENKLKRIEMTSLLNRALKLPPSTTTLDFKDIEKSSPEMVDELRAVYEAGIVKGSNGYFNPNGLITREQIALMLLRAHEFETGVKYSANVEVPFTDIAKLDDESKRAIAFLIEHEIVDSKPEFKPKDQVTRAVAAKMLVNFMNR